MYDTILIVEEARARRRARENPSRHDRMLAEFRRLQRESAERQPLGHAWQTQALPHRCRVLVPVGGPALAAVATPVAAQLATTLSAEVILLRVAPPPAKRAPAGADLLPPVDRAERQADADLRRYESAFDGLSVRRVVLIGDPATEIAGWLRRCPVDLVVMASRARSRLRRLLGGSVAEAVQRSGLAPVVLVPAPPDPRARGLLLGRLQRA
jgi:nucleotide-binding universal stress UspA family protein